MSFLCYTIKGNFLEWFYLFKCIFKVHTGVHLNSDHGYISPHVLLHRKG